MTERIVSFGTFKIDGINSFNGIRRPYEIREFPMSSQFLLDPIDGKKLKTNEKIHI